MRGEDAVIIDVVRTANGRRNGALSGWHPSDLAARSMRALIDRNNIDPARIDDVIMGCVNQVGAQSMNIGRSAVLAANFPPSVPATTIERQSGSSQQAVHFATQGVVAGAYDLVIAAGIEMMSVVPMGIAALVKDAGRPFGPAMTARFGADGGLLPQGVAAERTAEALGLGREQLDDFGLRSHRRAARARDEGRFDREIIPIHRRWFDRDSGRVIETEQILTADEEIGAPTTEALAALKPLFSSDGTVTAGNSAPMADGAAAVLITSETTARRLELTPRARLVATSVAATDPISPVPGSIPATAKVLDTAGLALDDIDRFEVDETFAVSVLAWHDAHHADIDRVNVNGGAIALGQPLGSAGIRLLATLVGELERSGGRFGLQTMGELGGTANATIIERLG